VANNGKEALRFLKFNNYALVLMDCMMPVMNGYDTTTVIRDHSSDVKDHTIPVIALTANTMHEDRISCLTSGMNDFLSKPLEFNELLLMIDKWAPSGSAQSITPRVVVDSREKNSVPNIDIFNRDEYVHRNLDDLELCRDVADIFIKSVPEYMESIRNALTVSDAEALRKSAHKLKGAAANLSLPLLSETAGMLESIAKSGNLSTAQQLLNSLEQKLEQAVETLGKILIPSQGSTRP
jgi:two-component system sensor histidine kinase/response regulator